MRGRGGESGRLRRYLSGLVSGAQMFEYAMHEIPECSKCLPERARAAHEPRECTVTSSLVSREPEKNLAAPLSQLVSSTTNHNTNLVCQCGLLRFTLLR
ncbi:hypothetical protein HPB50_025867 [Hyalomma asiaticum]|uniref:Uncharacterized protein n=1 Tax=Hyalomma asiaticum TaxID=266040 RepID=A0ACB7TRK5_HYAAI|nr:hypothetical protein HPB50_025867 [Hyalomma asiaticum]